MESNFPVMIKIYQALKDLEDGLAGTADTEDLAQETLDFLAMADGLKPVFLLGRGMEPPQWVAGAAALAGDLGFRVVEGPLWDATPFGKFPDWYRQHIVDQLAPLRAVYICSSGETAQEIAAINDAQGRLSMTMEARLLGYPECCVVAHYDRAMRYHQAILSILKRLAGGEDGRMPALLRGGAALAPVTRGEIAHMEAAFDLQPAPFGSWNQCPHCTGNDDSASAALSQKYRTLAEAIDPAWSRQFASDA